MLSIGVLVSGRGTNLQAILDACADERLDARVVHVASSHSNVPALDRAAKAGVPYAAYEVATYGSRAAAQRAIADAIVDAGAELVVLAGYNFILGNDFFIRLRNVPVINTHAALLPLFGGRGMYGMRVHAAVLASGASESGATVHRVHPDTVDLGEVIVQRRVPVLAGDGPETLAARVLEVEHEAIVEAVARFATPMGARTG